MTIIWCMVPEIWNATDKIFCHSELFFAFLAKSYGPRKSKFKKKWKKHLKILRYEVQQGEFFVSLDHFLPFYYPNNLKNQNLEKLKKTPRDIIILHICTINDNHMMYGSWDIESTSSLAYFILGTRWILSATDRFFCHFGQFLPFYPLKTK